MSQATFDRPRSSAPGDATSEGTGSASARHDHVHGREVADANLSSTAGNISQVDVGDTASAGALATGARSDHQHALPAPAAASASAVGDSATTGSAVTVARADHKHGREAFATTADIADVAATEAAGSALTVPRGDHVHHDPAFDAWIGYVPTLTNLTVGNGTINVARYLLVGKTLHLRVQFTYGSTTTTGGVVEISLPSGLSVHGSGEQNVLFRIYNGSNHYSGFAYANATGSSLAPRWPASGGWPLAFLDANQSAGSFWVLTGVVEIA